MSAPTSSSSSIPFKSKKRLLDSPCSKSQTGNPNSSSSVPFPTPEKPPENRSVALSLKESRQAAGSHRKSEDPAGKVSSARSQLVFSSSSTSKRVTTNKTAEKEKLPEKYETLGKFFDALDSSIVLSKLRGSKPTFSNISRKIEHLTERRFCYSHLAQIKHILPEAIEIKRVLIQDETTCCMKPDLHVTLNADAVEDNGDKSKKISLRKMFRTRLADFFKAHPQGDEVPEEPLPEIFSRRKLNVNSRDEVKSVSSVMEEMASIPAAKLISSFMKVPSTPVKAASSSPSIAPTTNPVRRSLSKINLAPTPVKAVSTPASVPSTPAKIESAPVIIASTPPEFASTPTRLFSTSLESRLQKRSSDDTNLDDVITDQPVKLARRSSLSSSRSLNFDSYAEDEKAIDVTDVDEDIDQVSVEDKSSDDEFLCILPDELRDAIQEQERKAIEDSNPAISEAKRRRSVAA